MADPEKTVATTEEVNDAEDTEDHDQKFSEFMSNPQVSGGFGTCSFICQSEPSWNELGWLIDEECCSFPSLTRRDTCRFFKLSKTASTVAV